MQSLKFIPEAKNLAKEIKDNALAASTLGSSYNDQRQRLQKELNQLFSGLQNPSLIAAAELRDVAVANGYNVDSRVLFRIGQFDNL